MTLTDSRLSPTNRPAILIVDDDLGTRETFQFMLEKDGYQVDTAISGSDALARIRAQTFDLLLVDLQLPDMKGTDVARIVQVGTRVPFVLMSAFLTTEVTVEAMKLGATNVIEKPIWIDALRAIVSSFFRENAVSRFTSDHARAAPASAMPPVARPGSTAERWACYVIKGCESSNDFPSVAQWAASVGASGTTLTETCRRLNIRARSARDLSRVLRALVQSKTHRCPPEALLLVSDSRTLRRLIERGGLTPGVARWCISVDDFLTRQHFVGQDNEGLKAVRRLVRASYVPAWASDTFRETVGGHTAPAARAARER